MAVYSSSPQSLQFYAPAVASQIPLTRLDATVVTPRANSVTTSTRPLPAIPQPSAQLTKARLVAELPPPPPPTPPPPTYPFSTLSRPVQPPPSRPLSTFMPRTGDSSLISTLQEPYVLASFIAYLDWVDLYSLLTVNRTFRDFFAVTRLRDLVLSRYVPGYTHCLRARDMQHYHDVQVSVRDLDLLLISQRIPLHRYPMHALRTMTALYPTMEDDEMTSKLVALTQAHSRFVLILQSLVHSSSRPIPLEPEEAKAYSRIPLTQSLRELTFPAPLAYAQTPPLFPGTTALLNNNKRPRHQTTRSPSVNIVQGDLGRTTLRKSAPNSPINSPSSRQASKRGRRLSFFGQQNYLTPPPPEEPRALKIYSNSWRRSTYPSESADENGFAVPKLPNRRFASVNASSDSSLNTCPSRSSMAAGCDSPYSPLRMASPHDLNLATSRMRAPVLRVFVPCSRLEDGDDSLIQCEKQLQDSGIWDHLSTGDIVCNLGYVPDNPGEGSSDGDDITPLIAENQLMMRSRSYRSRPSTSGSNNPSNARKWLLFNGQYLVPYTPPDLLPLGQPLSLPSPFYYVHIMPPFTNLTYIISRLPVCDDVPQLTLVHSTTKVPSPHSPKGYALVKKYAWTARVVRLRTGSEGDVGDGWFGEWILEGEGTREGKETLLSALRGQALGMRVWELVREKSGGGKLWLKLLPS